MYVLHHTDKAGLYIGRRKIRQSVDGRRLKGVTKPLAVAAIAATALAGFFHYVRVGPNRVGTTRKAKARQPRSAMIYRTA